MADVAIANFSTQTVGVLLNAGGSLASPIFSPSGLASTPGDMAAADLNGDGAADLVLSNANGSLVVLMNQGAGTFATPVVLTPEIDEVRQLALADINSDGTVDLVVGGRSSAQDLPGIQVLIGDGLGGFVQSYEVFIYALPTGLAVADLDGDTLPDLVVPTEAGGTFVMMNSTLGDRLAGTIHFSATLSPGSTPLLITHTGAVEPDGMTAIYAPFAAEITNAGTVTTRQHGISLGSAGTVTNLAGGLIFAAPGTLGANGAAGILDTAAPATVMNYGLILSDAFGIRLDQGGTVDNAAPGAAIFATPGTLGGSYAGFTGVRIAGQPGSVHNIGTIIGLYQPGVSLAGGGSIFNEAGTIAALGSAIGIDISGGSGTVVNGGLIVGGEVGLRLTDGLAMVTNTGTIGGAKGVVFGAGLAGGTLVNSGTIYGINGTAVELDGADETFINHGVVLGAVALAPGGDLTLPQPIVAPPGGSAYAIGNGSTIRVGGSVSPGVAFQLPQSGIGTEGPTSPGAERGGSLEIGDPGSFDGEVGNFGGNNGIEVGGSGGDADSGEIGGDNEVGGGGDVGTPPSNTSVLRLSKAGTIVARIRLSDNLIGVPVTVTHPTAGRSRVTVTLACFAAGTRIATADGELPVERLRIGMLLPTHPGGALQPITWIGRRRVDCRRHPASDAVHPIRIAAGAFGGGLPLRDLRLSPDHAVFMAGRLVPVGCLVNGATIRREPVASVTYYHVELPAHGIILAERLPVESFLDLGNRASFGNAGPLVALHPSFMAQAWSARACAPQLRDGPLLGALRVRLLMRARDLGHHITADAGMHLLAGGRRFDPQPGVAGLRFDLPDGLTEATLRSRTHVPAEMDPASTDRRRLGIGVQALALDGRDIALAGPALLGGWHAPEPGLRWTDGAASIRLDGARTIALRCWTGRYWADPPSAVTAARAW